MNQITVLTGPERRRRWSEEAKERILAAAFSPGATVATVARQFEVSTSLIYQWRRESMTSPAPVGFAPAVVVEEVGQSVGRDGGFAAIVELSSGTHVRFRADASAALAGAILKALR